MASSDFIGTHAPVLLWVRGTQVAMGMRDAPTSCMSHHCHASVKSHASCPDPLYLSRSRIATLSRQCPVPCLFLPPTAARRSRRSRALVPSPIPSSPPPNRSGWTDSLMLVALARRPPLLIDPNGDALELLRDLHPHMAGDGLLATAALLDPDLADKVRNVWETPTSPTRYAMCGRPRPRRQGTRCGWERSMCAGFRTERETIAVKSFPLLRLFVVLLLLTPPSNRALSGRRLRRGRGSDRRQPVVGPGGGARHRTPVYRLRCGDDGPRKRRRRRRDGRGPRTAPLVPPYVGPGPRQWRCTAPCASPAADTSDVCLRLATGVTAILSNHLHEIPHAPPCAPMRPHAPPCAPLRPLAPPCAPMQHR